MKGQPAIVNLKPDAKPMVGRARKITLALQDQVKIKLTQLEPQGIIETVKVGGVINASPVQRKWNGSLGLCADSKVHVKDRTMTEAYQLLDTETLFHKLKGAKSFARINLPSAYYQIELDDEGQKIAAIITNGATEEAPTRYDKYFSHLRRENRGSLGKFDKTIIFQDDVLVFGNNDSQCRKRLRAVRD